MPVVFVDHLSPALLASNPDWLFLFGDNEARAGKGGQAKACRGAVNAVGIRTKRSPSTHEQAYWSDKDFDRCSALIDADFEPAFAHARRGGTVAIPRSGLGTGLAELPTRAPRLMEHIRQRVRELMRCSG